MGVIEGTGLTFKSGDLSLECLLHLPDGTPPYAGAIICHPHPQYGGDMYNNVVGALIRACLASGVAAMRFNFRGVGESEGSYGGGAGEQLDVVAALGYLRDVPDIDSARIVLAGYSFGAMVALEAASERDDLAAIVSVSNPTVRGPKVTINLRAPTLFVTGDRDQYCDGALLTEYREQLGDDVTVEVLPGVDHFWWGSDGRLIEIVSDFLDEKLPHS